MKHIMGNVEMMCEMKVMKSVLYFYVFPGLLEFYPMVYIMLPPSVFLFLWCYIHNECSGVLLFLNVQCLMIFVCVRSCGQDRSWGRCVCTYDQFCYLMFLICAWLLSVLGSSYILIFPQGWQAQTLSRKDHMY